MNIYQSISRRTHRLLNTNTFKFLFFITTLMSFSAIFNVATSNVQSAENEPDLSLSQQRLTDYVKYLSSDELEGRGPGTDGINKAAEYIASHFRQLGLKTDSYDGTPFQRFEISTDIHLGKPSDNRLQLTGPSGENDGTASTDLTLGFDFNP